MSKKRDKLMPMMSILGIILVVLGHSGYTGTNISMDCPYLCSWIYNFHMPLFFFISGYLFSFTNESFIEMGKKNMLWKKFQRLLVPYISIGIVLWCVKFVFSSFASVERHFSMDVFLKMFVAPNTEGSTMGYLWYLITLFMVFVVMSVLSVLRVDLKKSRWCIAVVIISWLLLKYTNDVEWFNISQVFWYMPFFITGILYKEYAIVIQRMINRGGYFNIFLSIVLSILLTFISIDFFVYKVVTALIGIWMSLSVCLFLIRKEWVINKVIPYGRYTYSIYLLSWFGQYATKIITVNVLHLNIWICIILLFIMGLLFPIMVDKIIDVLDNGRKYKLLRLIVGY